MWQIKREPIDRGRIQKSFIFNNGEQLTYQKVIELWQDDRLKFY